MANRFTDKIGSWFIRLFLKRGLFSMEKGSDGKGIFARANKSGISRFCYRYDGTIGGDNFTYRVEKKDGEVTFIYESMRYPQLGEARLPVDKTVLDRLYKAYRTFRVAAWNGYSKYNKLVCDGRGFSLEIKFCDGASLFTSGMNAFPPRYDEFLEAISAILDPIRDKILAMNITE